MYAAPILSCIWNVFLSKRKKSFPFRIQLFQRETNGSFVFTPAQIHIISVILQKSSSTHHRLQYSSLTEIGLEADFHLGKSTYSENKLKL